MPVATGNQRMYTVERRDPSHWGFYGALPMMAANSGTLLGNIVGAIMKDTLTKEQLLNWGWRIPIFLGNSDCISCTMVEKARG
mmetsp:Transcript_36939/g.89732  ORF Transcript_36939/g.89732 Transcript_36939/m.89732 type:complete len:83 (+) Transcript_36939:47-295(+)